MPTLDVSQLVVIFAVILFSLTVHEWAHAWTAARFGDPTAQRLGRISLNPAVHIDPVGTLLLPLAAFATGAPVIGWAKPVPVDVRYLARPRQDFVFIAAAGPASNLALAAMASIAMRIVPVSPVELWIGPPFPVWVIASTVFELNLLLAVFNMVPVPPLDGGNVLAGLLPREFANAYDRVFRPWGSLILCGLLLTGVLSQIISPPYNFLSWLLIR